MADEEEAPTAAAGWYVSEGVQRYWDGAKWLDIPSPPTAPTGFVRPTNPVRPPKRTAAPTAAPRAPSKRAFTQPGWFHADGRMRYWDGRQFLSDGDAPTPKPAEARATKSWSTRRKVTLIVVVLAVAMGAFGSGVIKFDTVTTVPNYRFTADAACEEFVKTALKSPSTAKFPYGEAQVAGTGTGPFTVTGPVDSQNGFGATVRSNYTCQAHVDADHWYSDGVTFSPN